MGVKIWYNIEKKWLEPMSIIFGKGDDIAVVSAIDIGEDPISSGWYTFEGENLKHIAITGSIKFNEKLLPNDIQDLPRK
jgi:hypothetical protein